ncbi:MAG: hypothetical protein VB055_11250 [Oscillospiraceae bacterium]|nr:hypothetical protein [Oscillospiraceae bacterium]
MNEKSVQATSVSSFKNDYIPYCVKWGRLTSLFGVAASFLPVIILAVIFRVMPTWEAIAAAATIRVSACLVYYFIEPISYQPVLGIPGTYMAFLSGNISNLRVPCSSVAQKAAGVQEGTPEGTVFSTIGVAVSIVVNLLILTAGVLLGSQILSMIPSSFLSLLTYMVPALYGAMLMQMIMYAPKMAAISVPLAIVTMVLSNHGVIPSSIAILINVFGSVLLGILFQRKDWAKQEGSQE